MNDDYVIQKQFVRLTEDHTFEGSMLVPKGNSFPLVRKELLLIVTP